jgi:hypothetical protein
MVMNSCHNFTCNTFSLRTNTWNLHITNDKQQAFYKKTIKVGAKTFDEKSMKQSCTME